MYLSKNWQRLWRYFYFLWIFTKGNVSQRRFLVFSWRKWHVNFSWHFCMEIIVLSLWSNEHIGHNGMNKGLWLNSKNWTFIIKTSLATGISKHLLYLEYTHRILVIISSPRGPDCHNWTYFIIVEGNICSQWNKHILWILICFSCLQCSCQQNHDGLT